MKKNNKKGFTLVELVIVVAVMAVLVAVAIPTIGSIKNSATDSVNKSNAKTIESIIKLAETDGTFEDGVTTLSDSAIAQKIYEAKLGITKPASGDAPTFVYNKKTGAVTVGSDSAPTGDGVSYCTITFTDATGTVSVKSNDEAEASAWPEAD